MLRLGLLLCLLTAIGFGSAATCYYPDGISTASDHTPCNQTIANSACCAPTDACSLSGLCLGAFGYLYRGSCTDETWESTNCPSQCHTDPITATAYTTFADLLPCAGTPGTFNHTFCCGNTIGGKACCGSTFQLSTTGHAYTPGNDVLLKQLASLTSQAEGNVTTTSQASTSPSISSPTSSSSPTSLCSASKSSITPRATIAIAVSVPLGILALGIIGFLFWTTRPTKQRAIQAAPKMAHDIGYEIGPPAELQNLYHKEPTLHTQELPPNTAISNGDKHCATPCAEMDGHGS